MKCSGVQGRSSKACQWRHLADLTSENIGHSLLLTCSPAGLSPGTPVISIVISNTTSSHQHSVSRDDTLAWMTSDGVPKFKKVGGGQTGGKVFVAGSFDKDEPTRSKLEVLFLQYNASVSAAFACRVTLHGHQANIETKDYRVHVDPIIKRKVKEEEEKEEEEDEEEERPLSSSGKDSDSSAKKYTTRRPERAEDPTLRSGSVLQPTVLEAGTPMSVVIAMLVLIIIITIITIITPPHPPHHHHHHHHHHPPIIPPIIPMGVLEAGTPMSVVIAMLVLIIIITIITIITPPIPPITTITIITIIPPIIPPIIPMGVLEAGTPMSVVIAMLVLIIIITIITIITPPIPPITTITIITIIPPIIPPIIPMGVLEAGTPMSVVIAMLVLITLLFVVTSILLLQKFKGKEG
ncbi:hypothetical protein ACOMHN_029874 [Nucella lapillus]